MQEQKLTSLIDISHYMIQEDSLNLVVPGDLITSEQGFIKYPLPHQVDTAPTGNKIPFMPP
jgi:hypothetical protein